MFKFGLSKIFRTQAGDIKKAAKTHTNLPPEDYRTLITQIPAILASGNEHAESFVEQIMENAYAEDAQALMKEMSRCLETNKDFAFKYFAKISSHQNVRIQDYLPELMKTDWEAGKEIYKNAVKNLGFKILDKGTIKVIAATNAESKDFVFKHANDYVFAQKNADKSKDEDEDKDTNENLKPLLEMLPLMTHIDAEKTATLAENILQKRPELADFVLNIGASPEEKQKDIISRIAQSSPKAALSVLESAAKARRYKTYYSYPYHNVMSRAVSLAATAPDKTFEMIRNFLADEKELRQEALKEAHRHSWPMEKNAEYADTEAAQALAKFMPRLEEVDPEATAQLKTLMQYDIIMNRAIKETKASEDSQKAKQQQMHQAAAEAKENLAQALQHFGL